MSDVNVKEELSRTASLIGADGVERLKNSTVAVIGLGGVGSFTAEALARAGVGTLVIVDNDRITLSNINRQLYALHSTVGLAKTEVAEQRIHDINPDCIVQRSEVFVSAENIDELGLAHCDYVVDAIDSVFSKLALIKYCHEKDIKLICSMGTGNKLDPSAFRIEDITKTSVCPLARKIRLELRKSGIKHQKVLYSTEVPKVMQKPPASISFVPPVAGLMLAGEVIRTISAT